MSHSSSRTLRGRSVLALAIAAVAVGAMSTRAEAASCPGFSTKGVAVRSVSVTGISCKTATADLKRAIAARKGRGSWSCAGFAWSVSGNRVTGKAGAKRIRATLR